MWVLKGSVVRLAIPPLPPKAEEGGSMLVAKYHQQESDPFLDIAQSEMTDLLRRCNQVLIPQD
jgi:hypothetical protein